MSPAHKRVIQALQYRPRRANEVATAAGITVDYARSILAEMYKNKVIHICDWVKTGKQTTKVYALGTGKDKQKPRPLEKVEIMQRYNERWRAVIRRKQRKHVTPWTGLGCL